MPFQIIRNDITKIKADAIVNTANPKPKYASGTDNAIYKAAGADKLLAERQKIGEISRGQAVETPAFDLDAKYIIHTVGPVWVDGNHDEEEILKACYENSLNLALKLKCNSIAFPLISSGVYGFPKDKALEIALSVIQPFVMKHNMDVILAVFDKTAFELSGNVVGKIKEFVDSHYVEEAQRKEYSFDIESRRRNLLSNEGHYHLRPEMDYRREVPESDCSSEQKGHVDINKLIASSKKTFQERLFEIIDERGLTGPQVYNGYISKQVFSKIQSDKNYHPNKYTALALCLSLHLDIDETKDLIGRAGWSLSPSNKADLVVTGCIMNKEYNIVNINIILFEFHCPNIENINIEEM